MTFTPKTILLTGGAGFIGSNLVHHLLASDEQVRIVTLDALTYAGDMANLADLPDADRHTFVHGDICDGDLVARLLREHRIDTITHLAAESHVDRSIEGPDAFVRTNVMGTFTLLDAARRYWLGELGLDAAGCRFHHVSTDEVYGDLEADDPPFHETTPYQPSSPYSASKAGSDHLVRAYGRTYGLPVVITNCSNNYGPRQHTEKFIPVVIRACVEGRPIPVYGKGENVRDWLHVDDHCRAIDAVIRGGQIGESYNVGGRAERSNIQTCRAICQAMDTIAPGNAPHERLITFVTDRPGHDFRYAIDCSRIENELGWRQNHGFEDGLAATVAWYANRR